MHVSPGNVESALYCKLLRVSDFPFFNFSLSSSDELDWALLQVSELLIE